MNDAEDPRPLRPLSPGQFVTAVICFEMGLGGLGLLLAWWFGLWSLQGGAVIFIADQPRFVGSVLFETLAGVVAVVPLVLLLLWTDLRPVGGLRRVRRILRSRVLPMFARCRLIDLAAISIAAGFGEEVLFRWAIQTGMNSMWGEHFGPLFGLMLASVAFGACHWLNPAYAAATALVGVYLGLLLIVCDSLLVPITAHAVYDFVALVYLLRRRPVRPVLPDERGEDSIV